MNNKFKLLAVAILAIGFSVVGNQANAQYGYNCNPGYGVGYGAYSYGYAAPLGYGYSSYYAGYPGYSTLYAPRVYTGTSLYVAPGRYSTARVVVPAYPVYRPVVVPTPFGPGVLPGPRLRVGF